MDPPSVGAVFRYELQRRRREVEQQQVMVESMVRVMGELFGRKR